MKLKRILAGITSAALIISSFSMTVLAEEQISPVLSEMPDAIATVVLDNEECIEQSNLENLSLCISKKGDSTVLAEIPLEKDVYDEEDGFALVSWTGMAMDAVSDDVMAELAALQGEFNFDELDDVDTMSELEDVESELEEVADILDGYDVTIKGAPEGHYTVDATGMVITPEIMEEVMNLVEELFVEMIKYENPDYVAPESFSQLFKDFCAIAEITMNDLFGDIVGEGIEIDESIWEDVDAVIDYLCSDAYKGTLIVDAYLECDCAETISYDVIHEYYKIVDGKKTLVGTANYGTVVDEDWGENYYEGKKGDLIKAEDYINCEFGGKTYEYVGSYEYFEEYELSEFILSSDWDAPCGFILRYEIVEEGSADAGKDNVDKDDAASDNKNTVNVDTKTEGTDTAAKTGDSSAVTMYAVLLMAAGYVIVSRRKNEV